MDNATIIEAQKRVFLGGVWVEVKLVRTTAKHDGRALRAFAKVLE